ncbi:uncharacterized protein KY384_008781 [Bacidia gigantensis]|uniref:uncharacterized protein n=1 Tax=Bacidia gigantensis TaxID=2732470 RepID=UPI001D03CCCC|nr:uncharacterized protein KY384_008781 [Bacidia gigantensis]KAG8526580.1 hypothetical protein KY384_008781 [Bacidia gigantensis]
MGTKKHRRSRRHDLNEDRLAKLNAENASLDLAKRANHRMGKSMRDKLKKEKALLIEQIKTQQSHITGSSLEGSKMASEPSIYVDMLGERRRFKAGTRGGQAWQQEMSKHRKLRDVEMEKLIAQGINPNPFNLKPVQHEPLPDIPEAEFRDTNDQTMFAEVSPKDH